MYQALSFALAGYLSGSVLFARLALRLARRPGALQNTRDENPGTANAFAQGGFFCGMFTLCGDLCKGFWPVHLYLLNGGNFHAFPIMAALVLAAPVLGHAFPLFFRFRGGKGIAATFGCLLGLLPMATPLATFALLFLLFSLVLRVTPNFYRTLVTYPATLGVLLLLRCEPGIVGGFLCITAVVCLRLHLSREPREQVQVALLWKR